MNAAPARVAWCWRGPGVPGPRSALILPQRRPQTPDDYRRRARLSEFKSAGSNVKLSLSLSLWPAAEPMREARDRPRAAARVSSRCLPLERASRLNNVKNKPYDRLTTLPRGDGNFPAAARYLLKLVARLRCVQFIQTTPGTRNCCPWADPEPGRATHLRARLGSARARSVIRGVPACQNDANRQGTRMGSAISTHGYVGCWGWRNGRGV